MTLMRYLQLHNLHANCREVDNIVFDLGLALQLQVVAVASQLLVVADVANDQSLTVIISVVLLVAGGHSGCHQSRLQSGSKWGQTLL